MFRHRRRRGIRISVLLALVGLLTHLTAHSDAYNTNGSGIVLNGYDVVAYFEGEAAPGSNNYALETEQGVFWFSSPQNREIFSSKPEKYLPAYDGYCAFGVRMGRKLPIDPESFLVHDERLYVLLNRATKRLFMDDLQRNLEIANRLWPQVKLRPPEN